MADYFRMSEEPSDGKAADGDSADGGLARRRLKPATPERLERVALFHLERYATSVANLRRLLLRRVARAAEVHGDDPAEGAAAVEALLVRLQAAGLLDDRLYAEARAFGLNRRGASSRGIGARLAAKGVGAEDIARALDSLAGEFARPDLAAALAFARRRRLGPYRPADARATARTKDLASLGRQGFSYGLAVTVIDAEDPEALERLAREGE